MWKVPRRQRQRGVPPLEIRLTARPGVGGIVLQELPELDLVQHEDLSQGAGAFAVEQVGTKTPGSPPPPAGRRCPPPPAPVPRSTPPRPPAGGQSGCRCCPQPMTSAFSGVQKYRTGSAPVSGSSSSMEKSRGRLKKVWMSLRVDIKLFLSGRKGPTGGSCSRRGHGPMQGCTPHFLFRLAEKKTGRARSKRKGRLDALRCSCPPRDGGRRTGACSDLGLPSGTLDSSARL